MKLELIRTEPGVPGVESFFFKPLESFTWKPGQFLHYVLHHEPSDARGSDRWFTISSAPFEGEVAITTRIAEHGSSFKAALAAMKPGETIEISDIDGDFTIEDPARKYVFIAGGIGITPFHSILKEADHAKQQLEVTLLYANRDEQIPYRAELDAFAKNNPHLNIKYFVGERIDEKAIRDSVPSLSDAFFYVSGPEPMVESFGNLLKEMGVAPASIRQDWFPGYPAE